MSAPRLPSRHLYRYPVKGLPGICPRSRWQPARRFGRPPLRHRKRPERLRSRRPEWMVKAHFLMLMRDEWLAALRSHFDDESPS